MNDIEHELRELLHNRSSDESTTPLAPAEVLKRSRRRQIGTMAIGGLTAVLVIVASVAGLRAALPGHSVTAAAQNDLPERTATIQSFTVTAPAGWTLIDWGPSTVTAFSFAQASPQSPPPISVAYVHPSPVFELANADPGLDKRAACSADAVVGPTDAVMVIALGNDGASGTPQPWPAPIDPSAAPVAGPCGAGYYASFVLNGTPYFGFLGVGADVSDADRQALFDAYAGLQVRPTPTAAALTRVGAIGYVLAAGIEQGVPWRLELGPSIEIPTTSGVNTPTTACLRVVTGNDLGSGLGCTPFSDTGSTGPTGPIGRLVVDRVFVDGAVLPDATAVEYQAPGQDPVAATILTVPDSVRSSIASLLGGDIPARLYWMLVDRSAATAVPPRVVQLAADGSQLSSQPLIATVLALSGGTEARVDLRNALVAAETHYTDRASYAGFTPAVASSIEPSLTYNTSTTAVSGAVSIRDLSPTTVLLVTAAPDGSVWCIANDQTSGTTSYGTVDAQSVSECAGGDSAWGLELAQPSLQPTPSSPAMHAIATGTDLGVTWTLSASLDTQGYCTQFAAGDQGSGSCSAPASGGPAPGPDTHAPQVVTTTDAPGGVFYVVSVPAEIRRVEVIVDSTGTVFSGVCVDPPSIAAAVRYCIVPLMGASTGTVHYLAADGSEPLPGGRVDWRLKANFTVAPTPSSSP